MENNNEQKENNKKRYKEKDNKICKDLYEEASKVAQEIVKLGEDLFIEGLKMKRIIDMEYYGGTDCSESTYLQMMFETRQLSTKFCLSRFGVD
ncbi:hypothetical protein [Priestia megaterium]|uniref:hypothetical protein n=1 Tax=Priestia megaterium TaxID=1404 RepID=UPI000E201095|nr:hypothetical protein [Priestia megaterium]